ncbi:hypothetical protein AAFF_G00160130 [Aldrovandia affinis]|uniref:Uncharacterized protein n=1 Tax=Aldrovandia affinis TaxID=143900 RepID=A0AAD7W895_9TELE|nr:hypothetical protein AAFF_G00160130 [Aldrovandia affinis]
MIGPRLSGEIRKSVLTARDPSRHPLTSGTPPSASGAPRSRETRARQPRRITAQLAEAEAGGPVGVSDGIPP